MPTKEEILRVIPGEGEPISREVIAEVLGETTYRGFQTQLDRFEKYGLIRDMGDHHYLKTEIGDKALSEETHQRELSQQFSLTINQSDLAVMEEKDFLILWRMFGQIVRKRLKQ